MVNFDTTREELNTVVEIAKRAVKAFPELDFMSTQMDISACHSNGCPLKLQDLLEAEDFDFMHDVFGINNRINRSTGKLENCFLPRYSA